MLEQVTDEKLKYWFPKQIKMNPSARRLKRCLWERG